MKSKALIIALSSACLLITAYICLKPSQFSSDHGQSLADRWSEVDLGTEVLDPYFDGSCYFNETSFAACYMALNGMKQRLLPPNERQVLEKQQQFAMIREQYKEMSSDSSKAIDFGKEWQELKQELLSRSDKSLIVSIGVNSFLYLYRDPHTVLVPRSLYKEMISRSEQELFGVGLAIRNQQGQVKVTRVLEGSPAEKAGIAPGDSVVKIDGSSLTTLALDEIRRLLSGSGHKKITLDIKKTSGELAEHELSFEPIVYKSVESSLIGQDLATLHLKIHRFSQGVCDEVRNAVILGLEQGAQSLILDLRGNPGGPLKEAACVADLFLTPGLTIFEARYFDSARPSELHEAVSMPIFTNPIVTITDSYTASAAELLAGALQDHARTLIVGERTYGKGSFQMGRSWPPYDKAVLLESQGLYYLPSGRNVHIVGLTPDVAVDISEEPVEREGELYFEIPIIEDDYEGSHSSLASLMVMQCELAGINQYKTQSLQSGDPLIQQAGNLAHCIHSQGGLAAFGAR